MSLKSNLGKKNQDLSTGPNGILYPVLRSASYASLSRVLQRNSYALDRLGSQSERVLRTCVERQSCALGPCFDHKKSFGSIGLIPYSKFGFKLLKATQFREKLKTGPSTFLPVKAKAAVTTSTFYNRPFDKSRLKALISWSVFYFGEKKTVDLVEKLKTIGYAYATKAGISLSIDDLKIPPSKKIYISSAEQILEKTNQEVKKGHLTTIEYFSKVIETWNKTSENLKEEVIENFKTTDELNPVFIMAFSGARGNISQVRQLTSMRGLMADPQGRIINFPIQSNFREGLTLTEYLISCYGARKGVVDTALRTATSGYLTRRLVDVAHHVIIRGFNCGTERGISLTDLKKGTKVLLSLKKRLIGRRLAEDIYNSQNELIATKNQEISTPLSILISKTKTSVLVRSPLTCKDQNYVCQLCYGWSLANHRLVSSGEAIGIIAAQSIGEPGTQLTMRTFHTGGVFSGEISEEIKAPFPGMVSFNQSIPGQLIRTTYGQIAFLTKQDSFLEVTPQNALGVSEMEERAPGSEKTLSSKNCFSGRKSEKVFRSGGGAVEIVPNERIKIPAYTLLFAKQNQFVEKNQVLGEASSFGNGQNQSIDKNQTVYSELSGQIKFQRSKGIQMVKNELERLIEEEGVSSDDKAKLRRLKTIFNPTASSSIGEFWILSAKKQTIFKPVQLLVGPGDFIHQNASVYIAKTPSVLTSSLTLLAKQNLDEQLKVNPFLSKTFPNSGGPRFGPGKAPRDKTQNDSKPVFFYDFGSCAALKALKKNPSSQVQSTLSDKFLSLTVFYELLNLKKGNAFFKSALPTPLNLPDFAKNRLSFSLQKSGLKERGLTRISSESLDRRFLNSNLLFTQVSQPAFLKSHLKPNYNPSQIKKNQNTNIESSNENSVKQIGFFSQFKTPTGGFTIQENFYTTFESKLKSAPFFLLNQFSSDSLLIPLSKEEFKKFKFQNLNYHYFNPVRRSYVGPTLSDKVFLKSKQFFDDKDLKNPSPFKQKLSPKLESLSPSVRSTYKGLSHFSDRKSNSSTTKFGDGNGDLRQGFREERRAVVTKSHLLDLYYLFTNVSLTQKKPPLRTHEPEKKPSTFGKGFYTQDGVIVNNQDTFRDDKGFPIQGAFKKIIKTLGAPCFDRRTHSRVLRTGGPSAQTLVKKNIVFSKAEKKTPFFVELLNLTAQIEIVDWEICLSSRGFSTGNELQDKDFPTGTKDSLRQSSFVPAAFPKTLSKRVRPTYDLRQIFDKCASKFFSIQNKVNHLKQNTGELSKLKLRIQPVFLSKFSELDSLDSVRSSTPFNLKPNSKNLLYLSRDNQLDFENAPSSSRFLSPNASPTKPFAAPRSGGRKTPPVFNFMTKKRLNSFLYSGFQKLCLGESFVPAKQDSLHQSHLLDNFESLGRGRSPQTQVTAQIEKLFNEDFLTNKGRVLASRLQNFSGLNQLFENRSSLQPHSVFKKSISLRVLTSTRKTTRLFWFAKDQKILNSGVRSLKNLKQQKKALNSLAGFNHKTGPRGLRSPFQSTNYVLRTKRDLNDHSTGALINHVQKIPFVFLNSLGPLAIHQENISVDRDTYYFHFRKPFFLRDSRYGASADCFDDNLYPKLFPDNENTNLKTFIKVYAPKVFDLKCLELTSNNRFSCFSLELEPLKRNQTLSSKNCFSDRKSGRVGPTYDLRGLNSKTQFSTFLKSELLFSIIEYQIFKNSKKIAPNLVLTGKSNVLNYSSIVNSLLKSASFFNKGTAKKNLVLNPLRKSQKLDSVALSLNAESKGSIQPDVEKAAGPFFQDKRAHGVPYKLFSPLSKFQNEKPYSNSRVVKNENLAAETPFVKNNKFRYLSDQQSRLQFSYLFKNKKEYLKLGLLDKAEGQYTKNNSKVLLVKKALSQIFVNSSLKPGGHQEPYTDLYFRRLGRSPEKLNYYQHLTAFPFQKEIRTKIFKNIPHDFINENFFSKLNEEEKGSASNMKELEPCPWKSTDKLFRTNYGGRRQRLQATQFSLMTSLKYLNSSPVQKWDNVFLNSYQQDSALLFSICEKNKFHYLFLSKFLIDESFGPVGQGAFHVVKPSTNSYRKIIASAYEVRRSYSRMGPPVKLWAPKNLSLFSFVKTRKFDDQDPIGYRYSSYKSEDAKLKIVRIKIKNANYFALLKNLFDHKKIKTLLQPYIGPKLNYSLNIRYQYKPNQNKEKNENFVIVRQQNKRQQTEKFNTFNHFSDIFGHSLNLTGGSPTSGGVAAFDSSPSQNHVRLPLRVGKDPLFNYRQQSFPNRKLCVEESFVRTSYAKGPTLISLDKLYNSNFHFRFSSAPFILTTSNRKATLNVHLEKTLSSTVKNRITSLVNPSPKNFLLTNYPGWVFAIANPRHFFYKHNCFNVGGNFNASDLSFGNYFTLTRFLPTRFQNDFFELQAPLDFWRKIMKPFHFILKNSNPNQISLQTLAAVFRPGTIVCPVLRPYELRRSYSLRQSFSPLFRRSYVGRTLERVFLSNQRSPKVTEKKGLFFITASSGAANAGKVVFDLKKSKKYGVQKLSLTHSSFGDPAFKPFGSGSGTGTPGFLDFCSNHPGFSTAKFSKNLLDFKNQLVYFNDALIYLNNQAEKGPNLSVKVLDPPHKKYCQNLFIIRPSSIGTFFDAPSTQTFLRIPQPTSFGTEQGVINRSFDKIFNKRFLKSQLTEPTGFLEERNTLASRNKFKKAQILKTFLKFPSKSFHLISGKVKFPSNSLVVQKAELTPLNQKLSLSLEFLHKIQTPGLCFKNKFTESVQTLSERVFRPCGERFFGCLSKLNKKKVFLNSGYNSFGFGSAGLGNGEAEWSSNFSEIKKRNRQVINNYCRLYSFKIIKLPVFLIEPGKNLGFSSLEPLRRSYVGRTLEWVVPSPSKQRPPLLKEFAGLNFNQNSRFKPKLLILGRADSNEFALKGESREFWVNENKIECSYSQIFQFKTSSTQVLFLTQKSIQYGTENSKRVQKESFSLIDKANLLKQKKDFDLTAFRGFSQPKQTEFLRNQIILKKNSASILEKNQSWQINLMKTNLKPAFNRETSNVPFEQNQFYQTSLKKGPLLQRALTSRFRWNASSSKQSISSFLNVSIQPTLKISWTFFIPTVSKYKQEQKFFFPLFQKASTRSQVDGIQHIPYPVLEDNLHKQTGQLSNVEKRDLSKGPTTKKKLQTLSKRHLWEQKLQTLNFSLINDGFFISKKSNTSLQSNKKSRLGVIFQKPLVSKVSFTDLKRSNDLFVSMGLKRQNESLSSVDANLFWSRFNPHTRYFAHSPNIVGVNLLNYHPLFRIEKQPLFERVRPTYDLRKPNAKFPSGVEDFDAKNSTLKYFALNPTREKIGFQRPVYLRETHQQGRPLDPRTGITTASGKDSSVANKPRATVQVAKALVSTSKKFSKPFQSSPLNKDFSSYFEYKSFSALYGFNFHLKSGSISNSSTYQRFCESFSLNSYSNEPFTSTLGHSGLVKNTEEIQSQTTSLVKSSDLPNQQNKVVPTRTVVNQIFHYSQGRKNLNGFSKQFKFFSHNRPVYLFQFHFDSQGVDQKFLSPLYSLKPFKKELFQKGFQTTSNQLVKKLDQSIISPSKLPFFDHSFQSTLTNQIESADLSRDYTGRSSLKGEIFFAGQSLPFKLVDLLPFKKTSPEIQLLTDSDLVTFKIQTQKLRPVLQPAAFLTGSVSRPCFGLRKLPTAPVTVGGPAVIRPGATQPIQESFVRTTDGQAAVRTNSIEVNPGKFKVYIGQLVRYGKEISPNIGLTESGQVILLQSNKLVLRYAKPFLLSSGGVCDLAQGDFVNNESPLLTLKYKSLKTEDIVQGIPKIEQLFEARENFQDESGINTLLGNKLKFYKTLYAQKKAVRQSIEFIQHYIIDGIQNVYQSQGVNISDKHIEIIVKQMTSKVKILEPQNCGLLRGDIVDLEWVETMNRYFTSLNKVKYEPVVLGITKAALDRKGFISAASFQETIKILTNATLLQRRDYLRGLKENVILGHLIPSGTGSVVDAILKEKKPLSFLVKPPHRP
uniref:DNA-directed RNA polymerase subunit beta'' n=1 Tax=Sarcinofilum mucosum TaxID=141643 RepID=A0A1W6EGB7_SARMC|nr:beta'' subunit of RNA polymerase [Sarcinofilum mucosum]ARK14430.1 beta'' subunit of RNA polymerase [Sarcinofilum mucosum]